MSGNFNERRAPPDQTVEFGGNAKKMYFESIMISSTERRFAVYSSEGQMLFYTTSVLAARMFMAGKNTNMWSGS